MDAEPGTHEIPGACAETLLGRWHAARLAATLFALSRLGHDLRGAFSPALLAAERLHGHDDPAVSRAADVMLRAIDRAMACLADTTRHVRPDPGPLGHRAIRLRDAIGDHAGLTIVNTIPDEAMVLVDGGTLTLATDALLSHLRAHGVHIAAFEARCDAAIWTVSIRTDRATPPKAPSVASEFCIAREWLRSLGGDLLDTSEHLAIVLRAA